MEQVQKASMMQVAPFPHSLAQLVSQLQYKAGWDIQLKNVDRGQGSEGLTLCIYVDTPDSYNPDHHIRVVHYMIVPPAAYDERAWTRWLLDQILLVEQHEACEFFRIRGDRPFSPNHGPGRNPYSILEKGSTVDARTMYTGEVRHR